MPQITPQDQRLVATIDFLDPLLLFQIWQQRIIILIFIAPFIIAVVNLHILMILRRLKPLAMGVVVLVVLGVSMLRVLVSPG